MLSHRINTPLGVLMPFKEGILIGLIKKRKKIDILLKIKIVSLNIKVDHLQGLEEK